jgi:hypothetical protein
MEQIDVDLVWAYTAWISTSLNRIVGCLSTEKDTNMNSNHHCRFGAENSSVPFTCVMCFCLRKKRSVVLRSLSSMPNHAKNCSWAGMFSVSNLDDRMNIDDAAIELFLDFLTFVWPRSTHFDITLISQDLDRVTHACCFVRKYLDCVWN